MGRFVNPDNRAFQVALNSKIYVDKTGILEYTNSVLDTNQALICNSRPRTIRACKNGVWSAVQDQQRSRRTIYRYHRRMGRSDPG